MKTIILATNFSAEADNALLYAAAAAADSGYRLVLFHLYHISIHALNARVSTTEMDKMLDLKKGHIADIASGISHGFNIETFVHLGIGDFYEELVKCIEAYNADIVVMGMPEKTLDQYVLGNTTIAAFRRLKFPVLSIPVDAAYSGIKHILFACDMVRGVHKTILERVREFAKDFNATVEVFHVREKLEELAQSGAHEHLLDETLGDVQHSYKNVQSSEIVKAIREEVVNAGADILVMIPYKHGFWDSLIHRSKTRIMAQETNVPLLSLPL